MNIVLNIKGHLKIFIEHNEVTYPVCDKLVEVLNDESQKIHQILLTHFAKISIIKAYKKDISFIISSNNRIIGKQKLIAYQFCEYLTYSSSHQRHLFLKKKVTENIYYG